MDRIPTTAMTRAALRGRRQEQNRIGPVLENVIGKVRVRFTHRFTLGLLILLYVLVIVVILPGIANVISPDWKSGSVLRPTPLATTIGLMSVALVVAGAVNFYLALSGFFDAVIRRSVAAVRIVNQ